LRFRLSSMVSIALMIILTGAAQKAQPQQPTEKTTSPTLANRAPDANVQVALNEPQVKSPVQDLKSPSFAGDEKRRQLADEGAWLLLLATGLKAEVDKTTRDTLSLTVIQKANEIERLAHYVKEGTKTSSGGSK